MKNGLFILVFLISGMVLSQNKAISSEQINSKKVSQQNLKLEKELAYKTKELTKQLNLDDTQQKEVYQVLLSHSKKSQQAQSELKKQYAKDKNLNKEEAKAKLKSIEIENYKNINASFKKIFSKEQWTQYEALLSQEKRAKKYKKYKN